MDSEELVKIVDQMEKTMLANFGIGLASNQCGLDYQLFIFMDGEGIETVINPEIKKSYWQEDYSKEGCLSFPDKFVTIGRPKKISVRYITLRNGEMELVERDFKDMPAKIFQHEFDHIQGKTII